MTNNFPEFTGRVCPAPCEGACVLGIIEPPVTIKAIEQAIADRGFDEGWIVPRPPAGRSGKKVAVVGSGPAGPRLRRPAQQGLAPGDGLRARRPHRRPADVRHPQHEARQGLRPAPRRPARRRGGASSSPASRSAATCRWRSCGRSSTPWSSAAARPGRATCRFPGGELAGVHFAMDYLTHNTRRLLDGTPLQISAAGKQVVVIGGGDTGTDCVATALRQGCKSVIQLEILPRPAAEAGGQQPLAAMAADLPRRLRPGGGEGPLRRRPAPVPGDRRRVRRRRRGAGSAGAGPRHRMAGGGGTAPRPQGARQRAADRRRAGAVGDGLSRPRGDGDRPGWNWTRDGRSNLLAEYGRFATSVPGSSPPATPAAARAWWSGRSTRGAARPARSTAT